MGALPPRLSRGGAAGLCRARPAALDQGDADRARRDLAAQGAEGRQMIPTLRCCLIALVLPLAGCADRLAEESGSLGSGFLPAPGAPLVALPPEAGRVVG